MQHNIVFIGSQFRNNAIFYEYIIRTLEKSLKKIDNISFFEDNDKLLFLALEEMTQKYSNLVLVCSKNSFNVVSRLLCTLNEDSQSLKDDMLLPARSERYVTDSYLLKCANSQVNVVLAEVSKKLPEVLFEEVSHRLILHIFDESEEDIKLLLTPLAESFEIVFRVTPFIQGWYTLELNSLKYGEVAGFVTAARALLGEKIIVATNIISFIIGRLRQHKKKLTTAESCTGGLISALFTKEAGSSDVFDGAIITYSNEKKNEWLGVDKEILNSYGAVSEETVLAMSRGSKGVSEADFALAVSGIAGPGGGSSEKPVGLVYVSLCSKDTHSAQRLELNGDRNYIQAQAAYHAIKALLLSDKEIFF